MEVDIKLNGKGGIILEVEGANNPLVIKFDDLHLAVQLLSFISENAEGELELSTILDELLKNTEDINEEEE